MLDDDDDDDDDEVHVRCLMEISLPSTSSIISQNRPTWCPNKCSMLDYVEPIPKSWICLAWPVCFFFASYLCVC